MPTRRDTLFGLTGLGLGFSLPARIALASAPTERRLVFIILRGAMDGLHVVPPVADPIYGKVRGALADAIQPRKLDSLFGLHPALSNVGALYDAKEALFVHACASPYRERSHFDGQDVLETAGSRPFESRTGWLNRLSGMVGGGSLALASTIPLALRGAVPAVSYAPSGLPGPDEDLLDRVAKLYAADEELHRLWGEAIGSRAVAGMAESGRQDPAELGKVAARFLTAPGGASIAMIELGGWDTHAQEAGRLARSLTALDRLIASLKAGLGPVWRDTLVIAATEFGRTVAPNGTGGTDHGTASAMMIVGGAVAGGRVIADWPGLAPSALFEGRDLRPTTDLRAILVGATAAHFKLDPDKAAATIPVEPLHARFAERLIRD